MRNWNDIATEATEATTTTTTAAAPRVRLEEADILGLPLSAPEQAEAPSVRTYQQTWTADTALEGLIFTGGDFEVGLLPLSSLGGIDYLPRNSDRFRFLVNLDNGYILGNAVSDRYCGGEMEGATHTDVAEAIDAMREADGLTGPVECTTSPLGDLVRWKMDLDTVSGASILDSHAFMEEWRRRGAKYGYQPDPDSLDICFKAIISHGLGGKPLSVEIGAKVLVCGNGMRDFVHGAKHRVSHRSTFAERVAGLHHGMESLSDSRAVMLEKMARAAATPVSAEQLEVGVADVLGANASVTRTADFLAGGPGVEGGITSAWDFVMSATHDATHTFPTRVNGAAATRFRLDMPEDQRVAYARQESLWGHGGAAKQASAALQWVTQI